MTFMRLPWVLTGASSLQADNQIQLGPGGVLTQLFTHDKQAIVTSLARDYFAFYSSPLPFSNPLLYPH